VIVALAALHTGVEAFYLPGVAPHDFTLGEKVDLKVNKLTSTHSQIPYDYYSLKFCKPEDGVKMAAENLGEFMTGDRIDNSPYNIYMREDSFCNILCQVKLQKKDVEQFKEAIDESYHHNWIIDNLPAASIATRADGTEKTSYARGFPVGYMDVDKKHKVYNHVGITIKYHELSIDVNRVVGFDVKPFSVHHKFEDGATWNGDPFTAPPIQKCSTYSENVLTTGEAQKVEVGNVVFTYDVMWESSDVHWASRWDIYLSMDNAVPNKVHWFSIVNSLLIVVFLSSMVAIILAKNLNRDIIRYNRVLTDEEKQEEREESGWKLVHADVFRPPAFCPMLFCVFVGTGNQLFLMSLVTVVFAALGFLSPANRGSLMIAMLLTYVLLGSVAGYNSANLYKTFRGKQWKNVTLLTAFGFPGVCFLVFFPFNMILWGYGSSGAVPILAMVAIFFLWFGISVPLVFLGSYIGFRKDSMEFPLRAGSMPRQIPDQPWYLGLYFTIIIGGILPFGACFVELFLILSSMWLDQYYYVFGFLLLVFLILCITCAEISMVLVYFQLCAEDYTWWWRSFLAAGSTAIYVFLYSAIYFIKLESNLIITYFLYFGYMTVICIGIFLVTGTVGFMSALWFCKQIFSSIKID